MSAPKGKKKPHTPLEPSLDLVVTTPDASSFQRSLGDMQRPPDPLLEPSPDVPAPWLRTYRSVEYAIRHDGAGYTWTRGEEIGTECASRDEAESEAEAAIRTLV